MRIRVIYWHLFVLANNFSDQSIRDFEARAGETYKRPPGAIHMCALLAVVGLLWAVGAFLYSGYKFCSETFFANKEITTSQLSDKPRRLDAVPTDGFSKIWLMGQWKGKWDDIFDVTFVIHHMEGQEVIINYQVEEALGYWTLPEDMSCRLVDVQNILCDKAKIAIGIELNPQDHQKATAKIFTTKGTVRTAQLVKVYGP